MPSVKKTVSAYLKFKEEFIKESCGACPCPGQTVVFDRGNPEAKIMIIGEAPGAKEDSAGLCFVGRAGKMLDRVMAEAGIDTARDTLIANVMKCRPPENRVPTQKEVEKCLPVLLRQIEIVKPAVLVLLGRTALKHLAPERAKKPMESEVGKISELVCGGRKIPAMTLYHPAYLLYSAKKIPVMRRHVKALKKFLITRHILSSRAKRPKVAKSRDLS